MANQFIGFNEEQEEKILEMLYFMTQNFSSNIDATGMDIYMDYLSEYPYEYVIEALNEVIKTRKYNKMPPVGEVIEKIESKIGNNNEKIAEKEAYKVWNAIKNVSPYANVVFDNPVTQAVIETMGGWSSLCISYKEDQLFYFKKEFISAYLSHVNSGIYKLGPLSGLSGIDKNGVKMIGDEEKCQKVLASSGMFGKKEIESGNDNQ